MTDCAIISVRQKEGPVNQIVAGAVTGGLLAFRAGARVALKNAIFGGMILGSIVVVERLMMKYHSMKEREQQNEMVDKQNREQRRQLAKMRPDLFEGSEDNLIPRVRRAPLWITQTFYLLLILISTKRSFSHPLNNLRNWPFTIEFIRKDKKSF